MGKVGDDRLNGRIRFRQALGQSAGARANLQHNPLRRGLLAEELQQPFNHMLLHLSVAVVEMSLTGKIRLHPAGIDRTLPAHIRKSCH